MDRPVNDSSIEPPPKFSLIRVLAVVAIIVLLAGWLARDYLPHAAAPALVSRARSDMRTLGTAIESYYIDAKAYPAWSAQPGENDFGPMKRKQDQAIFAQLPTFMVPGPGRDIYILTTPVAYLTSYYSDPCSPVKGQMFCYWVPPGPVAGWILWSAGRDEKYDLTMANITQAYDGSTTRTALLINLTYDPTNGVISNGDVYWFKGQR